MPESSADGYRLSHLRERWERDPTSRVFLQLAEEYRRRGEIEEALEVLEAGLEEHPQYLAAQVALGRCLLENGEVGTARSILEQVLDRDPTQSVASALLVETYARLGDRARASAALERCRMLGTDEERLAELERLVAGTEREENGHGEGPFGVAGRRRAEIDLPWPRAPEPRRVRGGSRVPFPVLASASAESPRQYRLARPEAADLFPPITAEPEPPAAAATEAVEEPIAELVEESLEVAEEVGEPEPAEAPATATLGQLYLRQGHLDEAEAIFENVLEREPGNVTAQHGLRAVAARQAEPLTATELLRGVDASTERDAAARKVLLLRRYLERLRA